MCSISVNTVIAGAVFVISNSCVTANKYVSAGSCYNKRVVECRAAAMVLASLSGLDEVLNSMTRTSDSDGHSA